MKLLSTEKNEAELLLDKEGDTFAAWLVSVLLSQKEVTGAIHYVQHKLGGKPVVHFKTKGADPEEVLKKCLKKMQRDVESLL
ncbi:MAG: RpoL/Rpb11 RNA polymerase subunit family protein [archaeon]